MHEKEACIVIIRSAVQADLFSLAVLVLDEGSLFWSPTEADPEEYGIHCRREINLEFKHPNSLPREGSSLPVLTFEYFPDLPATSPMCAP